MICSCRAHTLSYAISDNVSWFCLCLLAANSISHLIWFSNYKLLLHGPVVMSSGFFSIFSGHSARAALFWGGSLCKVVILNCNSLYGADSAINCASYQHLCNGECISSTISLFMPTLIWLIMIVVLIKSPKRLVVHQMQSQYYIPTNFKIFAKSPIFIISVIEKCVQI